MLTGNIHQDIALRSIVELHYHAKLGRDVEIERCRDKLRKSGNPDANRPAPEIALELEVERILNH